MNIKWMLEKDIFEDNIESLKNEITNQGYEFKMCDYIQSISDDYENLFTRNDCVVFYGSLNLARHLQKTKFDYYINIYCTFENYECAKYYAYFGKWLLNQNYSMLPYAELRRRKEWLYKHIGKNGAIFVRPSSGAKIFTGQLVLENSFDKDYELLGFYDVDPYAIVVVAEPRNIIKEWRLVIVGGKIIAGSLYKDDFASEGYPFEVCEYANEILEQTDYRPDPIWTMDICKTKDGNLHLLEIGSFSCADFYKCDIESIVREVSRVSLEMLKE